MGAAKKLAGLIFLVVFVSAVALRPLLSNPAIVTALEDGLFSRRTLLAAPLLLVTVLLVAFRLRSLRDDREPYDPKAEPVSPNSDPASPNTWSDQKWGDQERPGWEEQSPESDETSTSDPGAKFLSGQGGARDRDFEIEEEPPDAALRDHLDHLKMELGDDVETASDLETLEEVVDEVEGDRTLPPRCPQPNCDAVWAERTIFRDDRGRYQLLDDGRKAQCLECEGIVVLEE